MSLYAPFTKQAKSNEAILAPGAVVQAEGQALVRAQGAQSAGVFPSTGADDTEIFVGFAIARTSAAVFPESITNKVESFVVPSTGGVSLQFAPIAGQVFVFDTTAGAPDTSFTVTGKNVTGLTPGNEVSITYKYTLTVVQAQALFGNQQPGGYAGDYVDQIGIVQAGTIYTSEFDASVNWNAVTAIKLAANGQLTDETGTGTAINGYVVAIPSELTPFLGIEFSAPNV